MPTPESIRVDVALVGGGLANGLLALRLKAARPDLRVVILEQGAALGGRHVWCCFASDIDERIEAWLTPLLLHRWEAYEVRFPGYRRLAPIPFLMVGATRLHRAVSEALGDDLWTEVQVAEVGANRVRLTDGRLVEAPCVIDGRGRGDSPWLVLGWQKFLGVEIELNAPHGMTHPILMDATVDQLDGHRFFHVIPLTPTQLAIQDTRYSDTPDLDLAQVRAAITAYAADQGWRVQRVTRSETGVIPVALAGDIDALWRQSPEPRLGVRAGLFNPATGYSLPDAARMADEIAALPTLTNATVRASIEAASRRLWRKRAFHLMINRMTFRASPPTRRHRLMERFYRLPTAVIERFYAGETTVWDKLLTLIVSPPARLVPALRALSPRSVTPRTPRR